MDGRQSALDFIAVATASYVVPVSHAERANLVYNPASDRFQIDFAFDEVGVYRLSSRPRPAVASARSRW